jgi:8-oxo-dGTP diphosphatase
MPKPKTPLLAADCVAIDSGGRVLLIRRKFQPFAGMYSLPGGFIEIGETVPDGCRRELLEETGVRAGRLQLIGVYSDPKRDPRGHTVSIAYATRIAGSKVQLKAGDDAAAAEWIEHWSRLEIAFDHAVILRDARRMLEPPRARRSR